MDYFYYVKIWLKEWWDSFQNPVVPAETRSLTMEQTLFENLRTMHEAIRNVPLTEPPMRYQLTDHRTLASPHAKDLLRLIQLATVSINKQLSVKSEGPLPRTLRLDDWFVDERNVPLYVAEFYRELINAVDELVREYDEKKELGSWAHYVRKASPYLEDAIVIYQWYLEINE